MVAFSYSKIGPYSIDIITPTSSSRQAQESILQALSAYGTSIQSAEGPLHRHCTSNAMESPVQMAGDPAHMAPAHCATTGVGSGTRVSTGMFWRRNWRGCQGVRKWRLGQQLHFQDLVTHFSACPQLLLNWAGWHRSEGGLHKDKKKLFSLTSHKPLDQLLT